MASRNLSPRRVDESDRNVVAERVLGGDVTNGGGGGDGGSTGDGASEAQMLAATGHDPATIERESGVSSSTGQAIYFSMRNTDHGD